MKTTGAKPPWIRWLLIAATALWVITEFTSSGIAQTASPPDPTVTIATPADARQLGLESLRTAISNSGGVPLPANLGDFIADRPSAIRLGKALFWDMQVGSDGVQACGSCHFAAGADNRSRNAVNPDLLRVQNQRDGDVNGFFNASTAPDNTFSPVGPDGTLTSSGYPFVKFIESVVQNADGTIGPGPGNTNDTASSMGVFFTLFQGTTAASRVDQGQRLNDPVFNVNGTTTRRVEPRNTPTMINAVLNFANFWDGRANNTFNGATPFGRQDPNAAIFVVQADGSLASQKIALVNASLASQAVGPPTSPFEMSFGNPDVHNARTFAEIGKKLVRGSSPITPLGQQLVDKTDSVLGPVAAFPYHGITQNYRQLIQAAFSPKYWNFRGTLKLTQTSLAPDITADQPTVLTQYSVTAPSGTADPSPTQAGVFTQIEANFALFMGLSVMVYEATLVADHSPFDQWMESGNLNGSFNADALAGLNLFVGKGHCNACHKGPEFTGASVRNAQNGKNVIEPMTMAQGTALYDNGFYNIGTVPTTDDLGRGGKDLNGRPLAFSRQALFERVLGISIPFPITGDDGIPAVGEDGEAVCSDPNGNGLCDPGEPLNAGFQRAAVDGAFKTPGLRNQELLAPYMHNGGFATLRQVVEFYNRGGNFCNQNKADLDPDIEPRGMTTAELDQLVSFLLSLTDERVRLEQAPFDHPEIFVPVTGSAEGATLTSNNFRRVPQDGQAGIGTSNVEPPFLNLSPRDPVFTPSGVCSISP
jgi:cytochrome c peroxidase